MELAGLTAAAVQGQGQQQQQQQQQQPQRPCPRCNSNNTKFCYFNNYSLTQPRYFCKGCRRYWTHGGTLRNVPVGGSSRKSKRPRASTSAAPNSPQQPSSDANSAPIATDSSSVPPVMVPTNLFPFHGGVGGGGFLSSLVVGQSMSLQAPVLQSQPEFTAFGRQDLSGGWLQGFNGAGGHGSARPAATGAQFWTLGGSVGGATSSAVAGEQAGCGSNPNKWRNFPAVAGGGEDDN